LVTTRFVKISRPAKSGDVTNPERSYDLSKQYGIQLPHVKRQTVELVNDLMPGASAICVQNCLDLTLARSRSVFVDENLTRRILIREASSK